MSPPCGIHSLPYPLAARHAVVVVSQGHVCGEPRQQFLPDVGIARHLADAAVGDVCATAVGHGFLPGMTAEALIVEAESQACGGEGRKALIGRDSTHAIIVHVVGGLCRTRSNMSVVNMMMSPVVERTHSTRHTTVVVSER